MKRTSFRLMLVSLAAFLMIPGTVSSAVFNWINVGAIQSKVVDNGAYSETSASGNARYFTGRSGFARTSNRVWGTVFGSKDWTDENGDVHAYMLAGSPYGTSDEVLNQWEDMDADGNTLYTYYRYAPPLVIVDGLSIGTRFPTGLSGSLEEVNPAKVPGTANMMVESFITTKMGVSIHQKAYAWSTHDHDDYVVFDWTFINTGNIDRDDAIEVQNTLNDFVFTRETQWFTNSGSGEWDTWTGMVAGDTVRMNYSEPESNNGGPPDRYGDPRTSGSLTGYLRGPLFGGEVILYVDATDGSRTDDWFQPQMHTVGGPDNLIMKHESGRRVELTEWPDIYDIMLGGYTQSSFPEAGGVTYMQNDPDGRWVIPDPNSRHETPYNMRGLFHNTDPSWSFWHNVPFTGFGPYQLAFGDSIRYVWAQVIGAISEQLAWEVGRAHLAGTAADLWPEVIADNWPLPQSHIDYPEIMADDNDRVKTAWVFTGKDSLFQFANAAIYNMGVDFMIPTAPPAPDLQVTSRGGGIQLIWGAGVDGSTRGDISETANDFAGFNVYRARGGKDSVYTLVHGPITDHTWLDVTAEKGKAYYYYVTAFDDGSEHTGDYLRPAGTSLESGKFVNRTTLPANALSLPASNLDNVRVVPNPFNLTAAALQFPGEENKIIFTGLPVVCTIKIYTESGDLVKTIEHTNLSGSETWGFLEEEQSASDIGQIVVSGVYIAYVETPDGANAFEKFIIIR